MGIGHHDDLMTVLKKRLVSLCDQSVFYCTLLSLTVVQDELKTTSQESAVLGSVVQSRITYLAQRTTPPVFSWSMPEFFIVTRVLNCS
jgi:hypothetical protein